MPAAGDGAEPRRRAGAASRVGGGILLSRLIGLVRQRVFAYYFGVGDVADAFTQAFRIPNLLQNLFGEGVLSASFIPVYAGLRARGEDEARRDVAHAVLSILMVFCAVAVAVGVLTAPWLTRAITPGYTGAKLQLTVQLVRVLFPGAALFVLSAWALGVLNSHGRFFLSYASAVLWNVAMIASLLIGGALPGMEPSRLVLWLAWGSVAGALLQFAVQLPVLVPLLGGLRLHWHRSGHTREVLRNFGPVFVGRGVSQLSAFVDAIIVSWLVAGSAATLNYAQLLYMLPASLFGMSVTAAELPGLSALAATGGLSDGAMGARLATAGRRIAFFIIPSAAAFLAFGHLIAGLLYRNGRFGAAEAQWVWGALAGSAFGLLATTRGRLLSSAFYAMKDTRTPVRFALWRVALGIALALVFAFRLPGWIGLDARWGVAGLTLASGIAGWVEFVLLRRALDRRIGRVPRDRVVSARQWGAALLSAGVGWGVHAMTTALPANLQALLTLGAFGTCYLGVSHLSGADEMALVAERVRSALRR